MKDYKFNKKDITELNDYFNNIVNFSDKELQESINQYLFNINNVNDIKDSLIIYKNLDELYNAEVNEGLLIDIKNESIKNRISFLIDFDNWLWHFKVENKVEILNNGVVLHYIN